jgi:transposase
MSKMDKNKIKHSRTGSYQPRAVRYFSDEFKKKIVKELELKKISIKEVVSLYEVSSTSVYRWLEIFSKNYTKGTKMVLELESEAQRTQYLMSKVADLERIIGQKQVQIDFLNKAIELCSDELGYDVKKKFTTTQSNGLE